MKRHKLSEKSPPLMRWHKLSDELPERSQYVLLYGRGDSYIIAFLGEYLRDKKDEWIEPNGNSLFLSDDITHWAYLAYPLSQDDSNHKVEGVKQNSLFIKYTKYSGIKHPAYKPHIAYYNKKCLIPLFYESLNSEGEQTWLLRCVLKEGETCPPIITTQDLIFPTQEAYETFIEELYDGRKN